MTHFEQESDQYLVVNEKGEIQDALPEISILYLSDGTVFKVGDPKLIAEVELPKARRHWPDATTITFRPPFPAEEINRAREIGSGYILVLLEKIAAGEFDHIEVKPWQKPYGG